MTAGVGQAADKPEEVADRDTAPVTDRLDRYCDLESSSDRLWDYLQEGMFLMPITDVLTAQSNVTMAEVREEGIQTRHVAGF